MNDAPEMPVFHYFTGEVVFEGDSVITGNGNPGVIEKIISCGGQDSRDYSCPEGGILIREYWQGIAGYIVETFPDGIYWEDLQFISREKPS